MDSAVDQMKDKFEKTLRGEGKKKQLKALKKLKKNYILIKKKNQLNDIFN